MVRHVFIWVHRVAVALGLTVAAPCVIFRSHFLSSSLFMGLERPTYVTRRLDSTAASRFEGYVRGRKSANIVAPAVSGELGRSRYWPWSQLAGLGIWAPETCARNRRMRFPCVLGFLMECCRLERICRGTISNGFATVQGMGSNDGANTKGPRGSFMAHLGRRTIE